MEVKSKAVQVLEQRWELLKFELEQLESFHERINVTDAINVINDIQAIVSKLETGEGYK